MSGSKMFKPKQAIPVPRTTSTRIMLYYLQSNNNRVLAILRGLSVKNNNDKYGFRWNKVLGRYFSGTGVMKDGGVHVVKAAVFIWVTLSPK